MTARPSGPRRAITAAVCGLTGALLITGCSVTATAPENLPSATANTPTPTGVRYNETGGAAPDVADCDGTASLRPPDEMPQAGKMPRNSTMAAIAARGRLVVGIDIGSNPLSFRNPITGDVNGFDVDIAHWIASAIFGDPNRIEYRILVDEQRLSSLQQNQVDIVVKSMSITCQRRQSIEFSVPYFAASQRLLVYRNSGIEAMTQLRGRSVCATHASTSIARARSTAPAAKVVTTNSWADCLVMLQQGQVDAITSDEPILAGMIAQDQWLQIVGDVLGTEYYGVGINKDHTDLVRFVNGVLAQRRADGSWDSSYNRWLSVLGPAYPPAIHYRD